MTVDMTQTSPIGATATPADECSDQRGETRKYQEKVMRQVQPGSQHVVVAGRHDGAVGFLFTRDPLNWLAHLGTHAAIADVEVRPSEHAERIVRHLRSRFTVANLPSSFCWHLIDFQQAVAALEEIDLKTGEARSGLELGVEVMVFPERLRGRVFGFTRAGQVVVRIQTAKIDCRLKTTDRENVKPILRIPADVSTGRGQA